MDEMETDYNNYWELKRFYEEIEIDSWGFDETTLSTHYDSSSPEGAAATSSAFPATTKNIVTERNQRRKLNDSLYALRSVVPNITKMDKASTVKDAIDYIQQLQQEEKRMAAEIEELEAAAAKEERPSATAITRGNCGDQRRKMSWNSVLLAPGSPGKPSIEVVELRVCEVGENSQMISITCNEKKGTLIKTCDLFESLDLKIISASITSVCGGLLHTLFVETCEMSSAQLKEKIEASIAEYDAKSCYDQSLELLAKNKKISTQGELN